VLKIAIGVITAWAGGLGNIPPGWKLCDGTNGTPDLRDKFVVATGPIFAVDDTGGAIAHDHTATTDGHKHYIAGGGYINYGSPLSSELSVESDTLTTYQTSNLPQYYALAYIMYKGL